MDPHAHLGQGTLFDLAARAVQHGAGLEELAVVNSSSSKDPTGSEEKGQGQGQGLWHKEAAPVRHQEAGGQEQGQGQLSCLEVSDTEEETTEEEAMDTD
eukprot:1138090-Pelagomonas_calceolata.AAC.1